MLKQALFATTLIAAAIASLSPVHATPMSASTSAIAREAAEGPRGQDNERPGDRHGGRKSIEQKSYAPIAREASEGPRGQDNERPGDRRGGRG